MSATCFAGPDPGSSTRDGPSHLQLPRFGSCMMVGQSERLRAAGFVARQIPGPSNLVPVDRAKRSVRAAALGKHPPVSCSPLFADLCRAM
jgi:hypothetical protein